MAVYSQSGLNLLIWTIIFTIVDVVFVGLRFWAARLIHRRIVADDYLILFSLANSLALSGVAIWAIFNGIGKPQSELTPAQLKVAYQIFPAAYVTWTLSTASFKLSVLFLYTRVFATRSVKRLSWGLMGLVCAYCITFLVVFLTTCTPDISQLWNPRPWGHCRDLNIGQLGSVSTNLALDIFIIILPMPFLWNLKMRLRNKIILSFVFSLGIITIGIMIWRIYDLVSSAKDPTADFVVNEPELALTTALELWICIIIACIPTLGPLVKTYMAPVMKKLTASGRSKDSGPPKRSIITFGRMGPSGRRGGWYTTGDGSQDPIGDFTVVDMDVEAGRPGDPGQPMARFQGDAFTTTKVTTGSRNDMEMDMLPGQGLGVIRVQQDIETQGAPRRGN